ncbi:hypothetical protein DACRYDRAFT_93371 [Dacryopinax primogenitus]|uniref:Zn(2)-C6 fungal-type domain-containing protein n=1 Tax=Dacryopinax primogenitus (strain DJM 731) TaxID=1858805 RepID=M5G9P0_DACPD|nr:uncharacterized protein DACRYDRAFT_93371 [Dacryopinax primogenitus]EJU04995.1 hypothetical protein DACRYDRAFT_93371 [Dacryopinax primogenitus]
MSEPPSDSGDQQRPPRQPEQQPQRPPPPSFPVSLTEGTSSSNSPQSASGHLPLPSRGSRPPAFTLPPLPPSLIPTGEDQPPYPPLPPSAYGPLPPSRKRTRSPPDASTSDQPTFVPLPFPDASPSQVIGESSTRPRRASLPIRSGVRVMLACVACRSRKIKCNGEKPICENCIRRGTICEYDAQPRRRGPDKNPGGRVRKKELAVAQSLAIAEGRPPPVASPEDEPESPKRRRRADTGPREGMIPGLQMPPYPYAPPHPAFADPRFAASMYGGPPPPPHMEYGYGPPPGYMYSPRDAMSWLPPPFEEMHRPDPRRKGGEESDPAEDPPEIADDPPPATNEETSLVREDEEAQARDETSHSEPLQLKEGEHGQGADPAPSTTSASAAETDTPAEEDKGKGREVSFDLDEDPTIDPESDTQ